MNACTSHSSTAALLNSSNVITLRGSTDIVKEFFNFSVNNILYQRGVYPPESFKRVANYGLPMMITTDEALLGYLVNVMRQLEVWLLNGSVQKLILVIKGSESKQTLERWVFECECKAKENSQPNTVHNAIQSDKSPKEVSQEIQAIMKQITASITFLPLLNEPCCFDLLVYADKEATVPVSWEDSDPCFIAHSEQVRLRSFDTKIHKVDVMVSYKVDDE